MFKTYKGARLDLQHYKGKTISGYEIEVLNDDNTEFDLSIYDDIVLKVFQKIHGTEILSYDLTDGIVLNSPVDNIITWVAPMAGLNIRPKFYYHECYGVFDDGEEELIFHGVSQVI